jgi:predicted nucleic acid-binding Zn ribbon protein
MGKVIEREKVTDYFCKNCGNKKSKLMENSTEVYIICEKCQSMEISDKRIKPNGVTF